jgi:hypothetical protein
MPLTVQEKIAQRPHLQQAHLAQAMQVQVVAAHSLQQLIRADQMLAMAAKQPY